MNQTASVKFISVGFMTFFCIVLLLMPYLYVDLVLPRTEELNYSLYPLILWAQQLLDGNVPVWFADAGLGIPWPIPHTMSHTPLALLFGVLPVYTAVAVLLAVHIALQAFFTLRLCSYFKLTPFTSVVVLLSVLLAAPMEYLIASDATAVYMVWTLLPMVFYTMLKLLEPMEPVYSFGYASLLAFAVGYGVLNGHTGVFSTHVLGLALVVLFQPKSFLTRWHWFALASLLAIGIGAEKIYMLANEIDYFGPEVHRFQYTFGHNLYYSLWNLFLKPVVLSTQMFTAEYWDIFINQNTSSRTITLGSPLCAVLLLSYIVVLCRRKIYWSHIPTVERAMWLTFLACFLVQFTPTSLLPVFVSASWTFRDPAILIGLLLAGILCDRWLRHRLNENYFRLLLAIHLVLLLVGAVIFQYASNWTIPIKGEPTSRYNSISMKNGKYSLHRMLNQALACSQDTLVGNEQTRRVVYDGRAAHYAHRGTVVPLGLHLNSLPLYGFQEVSFLTKGLSMDAIHISQAKPYGMISTLAFVNGEYVPNAFDWVLESPALLNVLGIRAVIGKDDTRYQANGLIRIGVLNPDAVAPMESLAVYANPNAFPRAFFVDESYLEGVKPHERCPKNVKFLTCMDFSTITQVVTPWDDGIQVKEAHNQISMTFTHTPHPRVLLLNTMWRPEWQANGAILGSFYGLIKVTVPENSTSVMLYYSPQRMLFARYLTLLSLCVVLIGCCRSALKTFSF